jgi:hypothetical protein
MNNRLMAYTITIAALVVAIVLGGTLYSSASASGLVQRGQQMLNAYQNGAFQQGDFGRMGGGPGMRGEFQGPGGPGGPGGRMGGDNGAMQTALAEALGINTDELAAAQEQANLAAIDKAVAEGLITQAQADELKQNGQAMPFGGGRGGRMGGWLNQNGIDYEALLAEALGISVDELQAARLTAENTLLDQAVADGKLTQEQADLIKAQRALHSNEAFKTAMQSAFEAAVQQAVEDGVITQAQADAILAQKDAQGGFPGMGGPGMGGPGGPGGRGGHGGRGGRGGFGPGMNPPATTPEPSANPQG